MACIPDGTLRKKMCKILITAWVMFLVLGAMAQPAGFQPQQVSLGWELLRNDTDKQPGFTCRLTVTNNGKITLPARGWKIYFNLRYHGYTLSSGNPKLELKHISGELFAITPLPANKPLLPGKSLQMEYSGNGRIENFQDLPSGFFWVNEQDSSRGIDMGKLTVLSASALPAPDQQIRYAKNLALQNTSVDDLSPVLPTPQQCTLHDFSMTIDGSTKIASADLFLPEAGYLSTELAGILPHAPEITHRNGEIELLRDDNLPKEGYRLSITKQKVTIQASDNAGIFYGIQSLKCLLPADAWRGRRQSVRLPGIDIEDAPRFGFRGFMLDVARNFRSKKEVLRILDLMALYKLNAFHLHFSDDEGWRLEIPGLPELTATGGRRGYPFYDNSQLHPSYGSGADGSKSSGSGCYARADFIEILQYAAARHITVIPEIESPGHARAAVKAMQNRYEKFMGEGKPTAALEYLLTDTADKSVYLSNQGFNDNVMNVALPSVYHFMEKVIDEIADMYRDAGVSLFKVHVAGDETPDGSWERSPMVMELIKTDSALHNAKSLWPYYFNRVRTILAKRGLGLYGWQELVTGTQNSGSPVQTVNAKYAGDGTWLDAWWNLEGNEDIPYKLANNGYKTVLACVDHFYFDLAYDEGFDEPGDGWTGFLDVSKTLSFMPYNYYAFAKTDIRGNPYPAGYFKGKEVLQPGARTNIVGLKGALWGENLQTDELTEYQLIPKLPALAEKCWSACGWEAETDSVARDLAFQKTYAGFIKRLDEKELPRLDYYHGGFKYRIPPPAAILQHNQ